MVSNIKEVRVCHVPAIAAQCISRGLTHWIVNLIEYGSDIVKEPDAHATCGHIVNRGPGLAEHAKHFDPQGRAMDGYRQSIRKWGVILLRQFQQCTLQCALRHPRHHVV